MLPQTTYAGATCRKSSHSTGQSHVISIRATSHNNILTDFHCKSNENWNNAAGILQDKFESLEDMRLSTQMGLDSQDDIWQEVHIARWLMVRRESVGAADQVHARHGCHLACECNCARL